MKFVFYYDVKLEEEVEEKVIPLIEDMIDSSHAYEKPNDFDPFPSSPVLVYLSDYQLKDILNIISENKHPLAVLPHPDAEYACKGFGVDDDLKKAIEFLKGEGKEPVEFDTLYLNNKPVFSSLVIGDAFQTTTSKFTGSLSLPGRIKTLFKRFVYLKPFNVKAHYDDEKEVETAVSGIVVVQHKKSTLISKSILDKSFINDGMLHAFFFAPRSLVELFFFFIQSLFKPKLLPEFAAHLKVKKLKLTSEERAFEFSEDGNTVSSDIIELEVVRKNITIFPGAFLEANDKSVDTELIEKISALPRGEAAEEMAGKRLPFIKRASTEEFKDVFNVLRFNAKLKTSYLVLMVISTLLACFGIFSNSSPVVIGAMILAPLMNPVISMSMATLRHERAMAIDCTRTILVGLGVSFLAAFLLTQLTPLYTPNEEILSRIRPNLLDLGIAVLSGIAGAYAHAREEVAKTLAGVAIAVALIPPLAVSGIGLGWMDWEIFSGAMLLLITNLAGMVLAAGLTFKILGFGPISRALKGIVISVVTVLILCIPLAFGFNSMMKEHNIIRDVDGMKVHGSVIKDVSVIRSSPLTLSVKVVTDHTLTNEEIRDIKHSIESRLEKKIELEVVRVLRLE